MAGPQQPPKSRKKSKSGLIMIHTGNGKGKTTAALGLAFRALGYGWKILMVQFIKGNWKYGELEAAKKFLAAEKRGTSEGERLTHIRKNLSVRLAQSL